MKFALYFNTRQEAKLQIQWLDSVLQANTGNEFTLVREECLRSELAGNAIQNSVSSLIHSMALHL